MGNISTPGLTTEFLRTISWENIHVRNNLLRGGCHDNLSGVSTLMDLAFNSSCESEKMSCSGLLLGVRCRVNLLGDLGSILDVSFDR